MAGIPGSIAAPVSDLDKLKSEAGLSASGIYSYYGKLSTGDMYGAAGDYSRLLGASHGQADYSKLLGGGMGSQGLYHSFMQNPYMTSQLNMGSHQASLPNIPSSY